MRIDAGIGNDGLLWLQMQNSSGADLGVLAEVKNGGGRLIEGESFAGRKGKQRGIEMGTIA